MRLSVQALAAVAALSAYAAIGAAAHAQPAAVSPPLPSEPAPHPESQAERAERLRAILQLRPGQEQALQAYVAALDSLHHGMAAMDDAKPPPRTTPERLAQMQEMMARRQSAMTAFAEATRRFYDQLDAGQKRAFDALPMPMMHHGPGMMMMEGRGGERRMTTRPPGGPAPAPR